MINRLERFRLQIKVEGFYEIGEYVNSIPIFSRNDMCHNIEDLMVQLAS